jgi:outer membrane protein TolC
MDFHLIIIKKEPRQKPTTNSLFQKEKMKNRILVFLFSLPLIFANAADTPRLSAGTVLMFARQYHPVARQARLLPDEASAYLKYARGAFDPKLFYDNSSKYFDGKNYYQYEDMGLKVPTWFGMEFSAGLDRNSGLYINPEESTPANGLSYAAVSAPLLRNLITDVRRTQLNKAKLLQSRNVWQQNEVLNQLGADILTDYSQWYFAFQEKQVYSEAIAALTLRLNAIVTEFQAGGKSAMDTVETAAQLAQFRLNYQDASLKEQKMRIYVIAHLWTSDGMPLEPEKDVIPAVSGLSFTDSLISVNTDSFVISNLDEQPTFAALNLDRRSAALDVTLKKQNLLPDLSLKYNMLSRGLYQSYPNGTFADYKFGLNFSSSLFLRKERGDYMLAKLKLSGYDLKVQQKQRELTQKIKAAYVQSKTYEKMIPGVEFMVNQFEQLYENEKIRFSAGDATVFMVNARETKLLESKLKLIEMQKKFLIAKVEYLYSCGLLYTIF